MRYLISVILLLSSSAFAQSQWFEKPSGVGPSPPVDVPCVSGLPRLLSATPSGTYVMINAHGWGSLQWSRNGNSVDVSLQAPVGTLVTGTQVLPIGAREVILPVRTLGGAFVGSVKICSGPSGELRVRAVVNGNVFIPEPQANQCPPGTLFTGCVQRFEPL